jgi:hypothetical protein
MMKKAWKDLHFTMHILKRGNGNIKSLAYTSLERPILEYGVACWDPFRKGQVNALDRVQKRDSSHMCSLQSVQRRTGLEGYMQVIDY